MQACPYDALYIDPNKGTAAKCNYCAHRLEESYEPACVIVCPVEAIISGDLDNPDSNLSQLISENVTTVRKPEAGTIPNVYYLDTSEEMLDPSATKNTGNFLWSEQVAGVGHYAKYAEQRLGAADTNSMIVQLALEMKAKEAAPRDEAIIRDVMKKLKDDSTNATRAYDAPSKGILWGWEVSAYIWTKAIASGTYMIAMIAWLSGYLDMDDLWLPILGICIFFLGITGALLVKDLDRPERFLYVMLRPNWKSWLVKGAYILFIYGGILSLSLVIVLTNQNEVYLRWLAYLGIPFATLTGIYTAWLLQQAKARSWSKDNLLPLKFFIETALTGVAVLLLLFGRVELIIVGIGALTLLWFHGKHVIQKPQMESLL